MNREQAEALIRATIPAAHRDAVLEFIGRSVRFADANARDPTDVLAYPLEDGTRFRLMPGGVSALSTWRGGLYVALDRATLGDAALTELREGRIVEEFGPSSTPTYVGVRFEFDEIARSSRPSGPPTRHSSSTRSRSEGRRTGGRTSPPCSLR